MRIAIVATILASSVNGFASPMRPLPKPSSRPATTGPAYYVAPNGADTANGTKDAPWKTIAHAFAMLKPGDTLYLRAGTYYESPKLSRSGTANAPITIRSAPGELAVIDAGIPEFAQSPATAWQPTSTPAELQSTATYPNITTKPDTIITGNFVDSMIPLHGYRFVEDLRATTPYWTVKNTTEAGTGVYVGPGVWLDPTTHRIHIRLSAIGLPDFPDYTGPSDPRKLPLVIAGDRSALTIEDAKHVRIQDLVFRGSATRTVKLDKVADVVLDGVTIYGGAPALHAHATDHLTITHSALRGSAAPWSSRPSMKYRGNSPYLLVADSTLPQSTNWEIANSDFTDGHDGIVIDSVKKLRFHNNRVDNFNDDALYLTLTPRASVPEDIQIYENVFSRSFTVLAFGETGPHTTNPVGAGVHIFRNVFDLRDQTHRVIPRDPTDKRLRGPESNGRMCGDHGNPVWEPVFFYQNTVVTSGKPFRDNYGGGIVQRVTGSQRRVFNNVFVRLDGNPGLNFGSPTEDLQVDGNLLWGVATGATVRGDYFAKFRAGNVFSQSKSVYAPGWGASDKFADPLLTALTPAGPLDVRLQQKSPAIDAGIAVPAAWPDPMRKLDPGKPDIGALPAGAAMFAAGL